MNPVKIVCFCSIIFEGIVYPNKKKRSVIDEIKKSIMFHLSCYFCIFSDIPTYASDGSFFKGDSKTN